jgi:flagellar biosynthetic protein FliR
MLMPGFSSPRVPVNVRLFIALAVTLGLTPLLAPEVQKVLPLASPTLTPENSLLGLVWLLISELLKGGLIGFIGRIFFAALETLANMVAMGIGLASALGVPLEEGEPLPALASLITLVATVLIFATDQHWEVLRGLVASYSALPVSDGFGFRFGLVQIADNLSRAFFLSLRIASPFIIFTIIVNLAVGLANRLTPQIPVYFISTPFVIAGGLFLFYFVGKESLELFMSGFRAWLSAG